MDGMMRIGKQCSGSPPVPTGGCRQTRALCTVREARAPPVNWDHPNSRRHGNNNARWSPRMR